MERLNARLWSALATHGEAILVGPRGCRERLPPGLAVLEAPAGGLGGFLPVAMVQALRATKRFRPRLLVAGSGVTAPIALICARLTGANCVVYLHGLDIVARHAAYRSLWLPAIRRCDAFLVNSSATARLARDAGIDPARTRVVPPGTELPTTVPPRNRFRALHGLGAAPLLLCVGRLTPRKGLSEFVERALPAIVATHPDTLLAVAGADASAALNAGRHSEAARILAAASEAGVARNLRMLGAIDDAALEEAYCAADVLVFPVLELPGDIEGFGMVAIEAAARGLPTVAFAVGGVTDAVVDGESGYLVATGDYQALVDRVLGLLGGGDRCRVNAESCLRHASRFSWARFDSNVVDALGSALHA